MKKFKWYYLENNDDTLVMEIKGGCLVKTEYYATAVSMVFVPKAKLKDFPIEKED